MKCHFLNNFGKTVNLNFTELTGINSLCSISGQEITKKCRFLSCQSEPLYVVERTQNSLGTAMQMWATFNQSFSSIAYIDLELLCS